MVHMCWMAMCFPQFDPPRVVVVVFRRSFMFLTPIRLILDLCDACSQGLRVPPSASCLSAGPEPASSGMLARETGLGVPVAAEGLQNSGGLVNFDSSLGVN